MAEFIIDLTGVEVRAVATDSDRIAALFGVPLREEVVRCRDCGWFKPDGSDHEHRSGWWCKWWGTDLARPDKFCAWGKRRTEMTEQNGLGRSSATDELRRMLDERGVEWWDGKSYGAKAVTFFTVRGVRLRYVDYGDYCWLDYHEDAPLTPEQAIAATLGPRKQPPYDELIEALRRDWDIEASWDGLRRFWYVGLTDEGVRKRDEREATLGRGECKRVMDSIDPFSMWVCDHCGHPLDTSENFCGGCGRKVVDS